MALKRKEDDPACSECGVECGPNNDRVFLRYKWYCGSCVYRLEYPHASEESLRKRKRPRATRQKEALFEDAA